jgi:hypothetical protein
MSTRPESCRLRANGDQQKLAGRAAARRAPRDLHACAICGAKAVLHPRPQIDTRHSNVTIGTAYSPHTPQPAFSNRSRPRRRSRMALSGQPLLGHALGALLPALAGAMRQSTLWRVSRAVPGGRFAAGQPPGGFQSTRAAHAAAALPAAATTPACASPACASPAPAPAPAEPAPRPPPPPAPAARPAAAPGRQRAADPAPDVPEVFGRIHSTESFSAVDGPGVRFVVFTQARGPPHSRMRGARGRACGAGPGFGGRGGGAVGRPARPPPAGPASLNCGLNRRAAPCRPARPARAGLRHALQLLLQPRHM